MENSPPRESQRQCNTLYRLPRDTQGFSLLEVLISIVILSFGLLGMVGLQATALQSNREARSQSIAASLARELAEMMRGNKDVALRATNNPYLGDFPTSALSVSSPSYCLNASNTATTCTDTTDLANAEMTEWLSRVGSQLPGARVAVCIDAVPFETSTGLPQWACTAATGANAVIKIGWTRGSTNRSLTGSAALERTSDTNNPNNRPAIVLPITAGNAK